MLEDIILSDSIRYEAHSLIAEEGNRRAMAMTAKNSKNLHWHKWHKWHKFPDFLPFLPFLPYHFFIFAPHLP